MRLRYFHVIDFMAWKGKRKEIKSVYSSIILNVNSFTLELKIRFIIIIIKILKK